MVFSDSTNTDWWFSRDVIAAMLVLFVPQQLNIAALLSAFLEIGCKLQSWNITSVPVANVPNGDNSGLLQKDNSTKRVFWYNLSSL